MAKYSFSQDERIKTDFHFQHLIDKGNKIVSNSFILYTTSKINETQNIGFITSKKIGNAVLRNKSKRTLKEIVRQHQYNIHKQYDILLIARKDLLNTSYKDVAHEFINSIQEASIWVD
ncbi:ribonuclease P protein component [bacterium]|nr:ribonuclease P protein component [Actinomycetota bacterium]MBE32559.1 ribonuclease P protein component [bacterium]